MTLLDEMMDRECTLLEKSRVPDGEGGWTATWADGPTFRAAIVKDSGTVAQIAEKQGVTGLYTVTVPRNVTLDFHDAFRSGGKVYRVTTENDSTPGVATFQFNQYRAEEWSIA